MDKKSSNLETFISLIQERLDACAPVTEDDIVRCIYVMLGRKARFNPEYTHEGTYKRIQIYKQSMQKGRLQSIIQEDEWIVICTDLANLAEYLGNRFGVDIKAIKSNDDNEYSHMKNRVTRKDGTTYDFDLYDDIKNIQSHFRTKFFGFRRETEEIVENGEVVKTEKWVEEFDYKTLYDRDCKLGFVSKDKPYADEYIYFLKQTVAYFDSPYEKVKFLIENISPYSNEDLKGYNEQKFHHIEVIEEVLGKQNDLWSFLDCYTFHNFVKHYKPIIVLHDRDHEGFFRYISEECGYREITTEELSKEIVNGLWVPKLYNHPELMESVRTRMDEGVISKEAGKQLIDEIYRDYY